MSATMAIGVAVCASRSRRRRRRQQRIPWRFCRRTASTPAPGSLHILRRLRWRRSPVIRASSLRRYPRRDLVLHHPRQRRSRWNPL